MRSFRGLVPNIVRSTIGIILMLFVAFSLYNDAVINPFRARKWSTWVREPIQRPTELAACTAHPETWVWRAGGEIYAYHAQTGLSKNPAALALKRHLLAKADNRVDGDEIGVEVDNSTPEWTSWAVWRTGLDGECGVMQYRLSLTPDEENEVTFIFLVFIVTVALMAIVLLYLAVTHPILRALHRLRLTASSVGSDHFVAFAPMRDDEIGEVGRILEASHMQLVGDREKILRARTALECFMADVAHDVRTPLASVQLNLESLRAHADPDVRGAVSRSLSDIVYLASLTQNLRLTARLTSEGEAEAARENFDLDALVERVAERQRQFAVHRSIRLEVLTMGEPVCVSGNATHTEQAVTNLLENAIAYGKEGGEVIVSLSCSEGTFELLVEDDGPGVEPDELRRLTERYFRAGSAQSRQKPGSGLGLSITQHVCDQAGWKLLLAHAEPSGLAIRIVGETVVAVG